MGAGNKQTRKSRRKNIVSVAGGGFCTSRVSRNKDGLKDGLISLGGEKGNTRFEVKNTFIRLYRGPPPSEQSVLHIITVYFPSSRRQRAIVTWSAALYRITKSFFMLHEIREKDQKQPEGKSIFWICVVHS